LAIGWPSKVVATTTVAGMLKRIEVVEPP